MTEHIRPYTSYLKLELADVKEQSDGGVYFTERTKKRDQVGTVLDKAYDVDFCDIGDIVHFENGHFKLIGKKDGKDVALVHKDNIMGVYR